MWLCMDVNWIEMTWITGMMLEQVSDHNPAYSPGTHGRVRQDEVKARMMAVEQGSSQPVICVLIL